MDKEDLVNFDKFVEEQKKVLIEKGESTYKDASFKQEDEEDLLDEMFQQIDMYDFSDDNEVKRRKLLHVANYAFFLYEKTKE